MPGFVLATFVVSLLALGILRALQLLPTRAAIACGVVTMVATAGWASATTFQSTHDAFAYGARVLAIVWTTSSIFVVLIGVPALVVRVVGGRAVKTPFSPSRRRLFASVVPLAAVATSARGSVGGLSQFVVRHEEFAIAGLPDALDGFTIGQITDVHVGPFVTVNDLHAAVRALDGVDLLVMTGDLLDDIDELDRCLDALDSTHAKHGCLAVLGNHDMWRGLEQIVAGYAKRSRVRLLIDESVRIDLDAHVGVGASALRVVGVDWPSRQKKRGRLPPDERRARMEQSARVGFADVAPGETVVCLSHHPDFFPYAAAKGAALTLAGHTHGGQIALFGQPLFSFAFEYMLGRFTRPRAHPDGGDAHLYVAGGTGHWVPYRFGVPREVTVVTLRKA